MNKYRVTLITGNTVDVEADSVSVGYSGQGTYGNYLSFFNNGDLVEPQPRGGLEPLNAGWIGGEPRAYFKQINVCSFNLGAWVFFTQIEDEEAKAEPKAAEAA